LIFKKSEGRDKYDRSLMELRVYIKPKDLWRRSGCVGN
jgi:hypothetical protein